MVTPDTLGEVICRAWSRSTSYVPDEWTEANAARGQCAVTALVVQDHLGGKIKRCEVTNDPSSHFFNVLPGDVIYDLTRSQFREPFALTNEKVVEREHILSHTDTARRYAELSARVQALLHQASA